MSKTIVRNWGRRFFAVGCVLFVSQANVVAQPAIPDLSSLDFGWMKANRDFVAPEAGPGPIISDKAHPYVSIYSPRIADLTNPILKPSVAATMKKNNEQTLAGKPMPTARASCLPSGVPLFLLYGALDPIYFVQSPKEVLIISQADEQIRHVYLNVAHSSRPSISWYGESIGHYENGELVVDTVGLSDKTAIDNYGTPHTTQLHVVERFKVIEDGQALQVRFTVDDPGAFNMTWSAVMNFRRSKGPLPLGEQPCAENNIDNVTGKQNPIPVANKPDF